MANPLKLSPQWIENQILTEEYLIRGGRFMVCIIYTKGGYYVTGESAPINPAEFTEELGRKYSREEAVEKIWTIEGIIARKQHYGDDAEVLESVSNIREIRIDNVTPDQVEFLKAAMNKRQVIEGDTVYLNSGSPELKVEGVVADKATCSYHQDGLYKRFVEFDVACLTHTQPKETV